MQRQRNITKQETDTSNTKKTETMRNIQITKKRQNNIKRDRYIVRHKTRERETIQTQK